MPPTFPPTLIGLTASIPDSIQFPALPPIASPHLLVAATTHPSIHGSPRQNEVLEMEAGKEGYEKLAHVGDALVGVIVTLMANDRYPGLPCGGATKLKALVVNNDVFADIARRYELDTSLHAAPNAAAMIKQQTRVMATVFEARVASTYYDYLDSATPGAYATKQPVVPAALPPLPALEDRTDGMAMDYLRAWIEPLFTPILQFAHAEMSSAVAVAESVAGSDIVEDYAAQGATSLLNTEMSKRKRPLPRYTSTNTQLGEWCTTCEVDWDGEVVMAEVVRGTKKQGMTVAAWHVAKKLKLM
ncbi:uncharacterized protein EHS24_005197 [Apiotrichum porosum]|uniref:RNase III domain-containing protein n=1 Tax=Apiotrichum porosum TaxID=105984 RepID=A0A427XD07_9TREE|nr:uncharacterized protein EHS24_005197 [Apiotrichum porosum]RSH76800.1 hypothetical protein EHS24_005197 [Apiotrichum porosum]